MLDHYLDSINRDPGLNRRRRRKQPRAWWSIAILVLSLLGLVLPQLLKGAI